MVSDRLDRPLALGTLALLMAFSSIATDMYLPAIPEMARALDAEPRVIEASMATFLIGFVLGQLLWGPASDSRGRKGPVLIGIALFCVGSVGCALAQSGEAILAWRGLQGFGGSAAVVIARAMVTDTHDNDTAAKVMSSLIAVMALAPLLGPLAGAQILHIAGWRTIFWTLCAIAALAFVLACALPETRPPSTVSQNIRSGLGGYRVIVRNRPLLRYALVGSFFYAGLFAFITGAPVVFIEGYGFSPSLFAGLLAIGTALIIVANVANVRLIGAFGINRTLKLGCMIAAIGAVATLSVAMLLPEKVDFLVIALMIYMSMAGLIIANALTGAIVMAEGMKGAASAFAGAFNFAGGAVGALSVSLFGGGSAIGLAGILAFFGLMTWASSIGIKATDQ